SPTLTAGISTRYVILRKYLVELVAYFTANSQVLNINEDDCVFSCISNLVSEWIMRKGAVADGMTSRLDTTILSTASLPSMTRSTSRALSREILPGLESLSLRNAAIFKRNLPDNNLENYSSCNTNLNKYL